MIKNIIFDLSNTLIFRKDQSSESLNDLHDSLSSGENFNFFDHFFIHETTFNLLRKLNVKRNLILLTTGDYQEDPAIRPLLDDIFKNIYTGKHIGIPKSDPRVYNYIIKKENIKAHETIFIDDLARNIEAAEVAGLKTHHYRSENELRILLNKILTEDTE